MKYELTHDTIARQVFDKASTEARTRRKVERYVRERYAAYHERGAKLTQDDVDFVTPYLGVVNISGEEAAFVEEGRQELLRAQRRRRAIILGVIAVLSAISLLAIWQWQAANAAKEDALEQKSIAEIQTQAALASDSLAQVRAAEAIVAQRADSLKAIKLGIALNDANLQRLAAERQTREAQALALVAKAQSLPAEDMPTALRLVQAAWNHTATPLPEVEQSLIAIFYNKWQNAIPAPRIRPIASFDTKSDRVYSVAISPDNQYVLLNPYAKKPQLWDLNGNPLRELAGHQSFVSSATFSPDGSRILTTAYDDTAMLWNLDGEPLKSIALDVGDRVESGRFLSNDLILAQGSHIYDLEGHLMMYADRQGVLISPNGQMILTLSLDGSAKLWDVQGNLLSTVIDDSPAINSAVFSPDSKGILFASAGSVFMTDLEGRLVYSLLPNQQISGGDIGAYDAVISPSGSHIMLEGLQLSGGTAFTVWTPDGKQIAELPARGIFSPQGDRILTDDGVLRQINGRPIASLAGYSEEVIRSSFSPDGQFIICGYEGGLADLFYREEALLFDFYLPKVNLTILDELDFQWFPTATISPDSRQILTTSSDNTATLWDLQGQPIAQFTGHHDLINSVAFSPENNQILTASNDGTIKLWSRNGEWQRDLMQHDRKILSAQFSPNGRYVIAVLENGTSCLADLNGQLLQQYPSRVTAFSPDGSRLLAMDEDGNIEQWNLAGKRLGNIATHENSSSIYAPDGQSILSYSFDGLAKFWSLQGKNLAVLAGHNRFLSGLSEAEAGIVKFIGHTASIISADISPDGQYIATGSFDRTVKLWSRSGELIADLQGNNAPVLSVKFSPDGQFIVSLAADGKIRQWPTIQGIYAWLENNDAIPQLTKEQRRLYGIDRE